MSLFRRNNNGESPLRETPTETQRRLGAATRALYWIVHLPSGNGAATANGANSSLIPITTPTPVQPAPVSLPLKTSAAELGIRARFEAAILHGRQAIDRKRTSLRQTLAHGLAKLRTLRFLVGQAHERLARAIKNQTDFLARVPEAKRRFLNSRVARTLPFVPWALWAADTMIIDRAWGLFGAVAIPFVAASTGVAALTMLLRAGLVSFGLIFGVRFAGGRLREVVDQVRAKNPKIGLVCDASVAGAVFVAAIGLAAATTQMQAALLRIVAGGSNVTVPIALLFAIVGFLITVSFACGYFLNEPELKEARLHEKRVKKAQKELNSAVSAENTQKGVVRSIIEELRGLDRQEQLLVKEQEAHADEEVYILKAQNGPVYGFEFAPKDGASND
jgi:uncharacterized membrane protein YciS (DUF1049 family)